MRQGIGRLRHLIDGGERLKRVFPAPPILTFRQSPNLRRRLVGGTLPPQSAEGPGVVRNCRAARCLTCGAVHADPTIARGDTTLQVKGQYTRGPTDLVYLIRCRKDCPEAWRAVEAEQTLRKRMKGHRATLRNDAPLPAAEHPDRAGHSTTDARVSAPVGAPEDPRRRPTAEQRGRPGGRPGGSAAAADCGAATHRPLRMD